MDVDLRVRELMSGVANPQMHNVAQLLFVIIALVPFLIIGSCNKVLFTCEYCSSLILFSTEISHYFCISASLTKDYLVGVESNVFFFFFEMQLMILENLLLLPFKSEIWMPLCRACLFASHAKETKALPKDCVYTP